MRIKFTPITPSDDSRALDYHVAEHVFGWRWKSFVSKPVHGTDGYPKECRVKQFFSPAQLENPRWQKYLSDKEARDIGHDEWHDIPYSYAYCSSSGPAFVPDYGTANDYDVLEFVRKNWEPEQLARFNDLLPSAAKYKRGDYSKAALKTLGVLP